MNFKFETNDSPIDTSGANEHLNPQEIEEIERLVREIMNMAELDDMGKLVLASKIAEKPENLDSDAGEDVLSEQGKIDIIKRVGEEIKKITQTPQYKKDLEKIKNVMGTHGMEGQGKTRKEEDEWRRQHGA